MKYRNTIEGIFIDRPNRFIAHAEVNGKLELVHVKNTGRCRELLIPGVKVVLEKNNSSTRKTEYDLIMVYKKNIGWINIDSQAPNKIVYEWLLNKNYQLIRPEYVYENSRFDFYMEKGKKRFLMEVKGCTLEMDGVGYFPDAPTERGVKHLRELSRARQEGYDCSVVFVIQMNGIKEVRANASMDPQFAKALEYASESGVKVIFLPCFVTKDSVVAAELPYYSLNTYLQGMYHEKIYKLALKGGHTCPNRDGSKGFGGCIFCSEGGSGDFAADTIDEAIKIIEKNKATPIIEKNKVTAKAAPAVKSKISAAKKFIAYYQSYTGTYLSSEELRQMLKPAISDKRVAIISIATRADCLPDDILECLDKVNKIKPVWVELGLQSSHERTAELINRAYSLKTFEEAVTKLRRLNIDVIVHLILGLPQETKEDMLDSVRYINTLDIQGIKLQLLHVIEGTELARMYKDGLLGDRKEDFPFSPEEYAELVKACLKILRKDIVVHRLTGDAAKKDLIAPLWSADKKKVLNLIKNTVEI